MRAFNHLRPAWSYRATYVFHRACRNAPGESDDERSSRSARQSFTSRRVKIKWRRRRRGSRPAASSALKRCYKRRRPVISYDLSHAGIMLSVYLLLCALSRPLALAYHPRGEMAILYFFISSLPSKRSVAYLFIARN